MELADGLVIGGAAALGVVIGPLLTEIVEHAPNRQRVSVSLRPSAVSVLEKDRRGTRDLLVRLAAPLLLALAAWRFGATIALAPFLVLYAALLVLSAIDIEHHRLPDNVVFPTLGLTVALVLVISTILDGPDRALPALIGSGVYFLLLAVPWFIYPRGLGFGDVKLAAVLGLHIGWIYSSAIDGVALILYSLIIACIVGVVTGLGMTLVKRKRAEFPFGPALALGCITVITFSNQILAG